jgi:hypothetical protein
MVSYLVLTHIRNNSDLSDVISEICDVAILRVFMYKYIELEGTLIIGLLVELYVSYFSDPFIVELKVKYRFLSPCL